MTAFQSVIDLRFAVADHVGNRALSDVFPRLLALAEGDINARLRTRRQIADTTIAFEAGEAALPPDFLEMIRLDGQDPNRFQVTGWSIIMPGAAGERALQYYARIPTLTCSPVATNWLLERYPLVYLYGVGLEAAKYLRDADLATATGSLYGDALRQVLVDDERARWASAAVRVRGPTP